MLSRRRLGRIGQLHTLSKGAGQIADPTAASHSVIPMYNPFLPIHPIPQIPSVGSLSGQGPALPAANVGLCPTAEHKPGKKKIEGGGQTKYVVPGRDQPFTRKADAIKYMINKGMKNQDAVSFVENNTKHKIKERLKAQKEASEKATKATIVQAEEQSKEQLEKMREPIKEMVDITDAKQRSGHEEDNTLLAKIAKSLTPEEPKLSDFVRRRRKATKQKPKSKEDAKALVTEVKLAESHKLKCKPKLAYTRRKANIKLLV